MQPIMLARVSHVPAFTGVLQGIGTLLERELQRAGLPTWLDIQPDAYIPVLPALRFFRRIEHQEGIYDIGFLASRQETFDRLGRDFIRMSQSAPTLYARLRQFCALAPVENTNLRASMIRDGNRLELKSR